MSFVVSGDVGPRITINSETSFAFAVKLDCVPVSFAVKLIQTRSCLSGHIPLINLVAVDAPDVYALSSDLGDLEEGDVGLFVTPA